MSKQPTTELIRKIDAVWGGVIWRLAAIGALLVIASITGGAW